MIDPAESSTEKTLAAPSRKAKLQEGLNGLSEKIKEFQQELETAPQYADTTDHEECNRQVSWALQEFREVINDLDEAFLNQSPEEGLEDLEDGRR